jgi:hypothetical protein
MKRDSTLGEDHAVESINTASTSAIVGEGIATASSAADNGGVSMSMTATEKSKEISEPLLGSASTYARILEMMHKHALDAHVQENACFVLSNIAWSGSSGRAALGSLHAWREITCAMNGHLGQSGVQEKGCRALAGLAQYDDNLSALGAECSWQPVLAAMEAHRMHAGVQEAGELNMCFLLSCVFLAEDDIRAS